jgi:hypothetical protein
MAHKTTAGKLLIATPAIGDGNFEQSIIYMLHHDMDGALGVVINRPSELLVEELLPRWSDLTTEPALVFSGGPVETNGFIGVARSVGPQPEGVIEIPGTNVITVDLEGDPALTAAHTNSIPNSAPVPGSPSSPILAICGPRRPTTCTNRCCAARPAICDGSRTPRSTPNRTKPSRPNPAGTTAALAQTAALGLLDVGLD